MLSKQAELLLQAIRNTREFRESQEPPFIHVSEAISTAAFLYERARGLIDFRAEHLLRKSAIARILNRRAKFLGQREKLTEDVTRELIRARYLPNDGVPEAVYQRVDQVLKKYLTAIDVLNGGKVVFDARAEWLLEMCAVELEELFEPNFIEHALVQILYEAVKDHIETPGIDDETKQFQLYIASYRAFVKSDPDMTEFHLLRLYMPVWFADDVTADREAVDALMRAKDAMREQLAHPIGKRLLPQVRKVVAPIIILHAAVTEHEADFPHWLQNPDLFRSEITHLIEAKYKLGQQRLWRRGLRALIYVFLTKIVVGLLLELPYDYFVVKQLHYFPLIVNVAFPPILLFLILVSLRQPGKQNTKILVQALCEVMYADVPHEVFAGVKRIRLRTKKGFAFWLYTTLYLALFFISFGAITGVLHRFQFNAASTTLFLLFVSIVSFFGVNLRQNAKELIIVTHRENLITALFNALTLPILTIGRWISENVNRINVFLFVLDVLIEAPLQLIMEVLESWLDFLREKREEV